MVYVSNAFYRNEGERVEYLSALPFKTKMSIPGLVKDNRFFPEIFDIRETITRDGSIPTISSPKTGRGLGPEEVKQILGRQEKLLRYRLKMLEREKTRDNNPGKMTYFKFITYEVFDELVPPIESELDLIWENSPQKGRLKIRN